MIGKKFTVAVDQFDNRGVGESVTLRETRRGGKARLHLITPYTIPGEEVEVTVEHAVRRKWMTHIDRFIKTHPDRVEAPCPHFEKCGGCSWQHLSYGGQLREKTNAVKSYIQKEGFDPNLVSETLGMEDPWTYRNKMEFTFAPDGSLGLHEKGII